MSRCLRGQHELTCVVFFSLALVGLATSAAEWIEAADDLAVVMSKLEKLRVPDRDVDGSSSSARKGADASGRVGAQSLVEATIEGTERRNVRILSLRNLAPLQHSHVVESPTELTAEGQFLSLAALLDELESSAGNVRVRRADFERAPGQNGVLLRAAISSFSARVQRKE